MGIFDWLYNWLGAGASAGRHLSPRAGTDPGRSSQCDINPATGLPMVGGCGGLDVEGNPYGTDLHPDGLDALNSGLNDPAQALTAGPDDHGGDADALDHVHTASSPAADGWDGSTGGDDLSGSSGYDDWSSSSAFDDWSDPGSSFDEWSSGSSFDDW